MLIASEDETLVRHCRRGGWCGRGRARLPLLRPRGHADRTSVPLILTTGGAGGDPLFTEGGVGRAYLAAHGVPPEDIIVENEGESTVQSVVTVAEIMQRMDLHSCIVVSDGYHIYRVKRMMEARGLEVYGSPRPSAPVSRWVYFRQRQA